jgi:hypothetical protein
MQCGKLIEFAGQIDEVLLLMSSKTYKDRGRLGIDDGKKIKQLRARFTALRKALIRSPSFTYE